MNINIITKAKAARIAGVNPSTIYEWVKKGYLNKYLIHAYVTFKISEKELREYIAMRELKKQLKLKS